VSCRFSLLFFQPFNRNYNKAKEEDDDEEKITTTKKVMLGRDQTKKTKEVGKISSIKAAPSVKALRAKAAAAMPFVLQCPRDIASLNELIDKHCSSAADVRPSHSPCFFFPFYSLL